MFVFGSNMVRYRKRAKFWLFIYDAGFFTTKNKALMFDVPCIFNVFMFCHILATGFTVPLDKCQHLTYIRQWQNIYSLIIDWLQCCIDCQTGTNYGWCSIAIAVTQYMFARLGCHTERWLRWCYSKWLLMCKSCYTDTWSTCICIKLIDWSRCFEVSLPDVDWTPRRMNHAYHAMSERKERTFSREQ